MKKKTIFVLVAVLTVMSLLTTACGCRALSGIKRVAPEITSEYEALISAYQNGRRAAANGNTCIALTFSEIQSQVTLYNSYLTADIEKARVYRESLSNFGNGIQDARSHYKDENGNPIPPDKLDLADLVNNQATPADIALNVNAYVTAFTEAPLQNVDPEALKNTQRLVSEKYNQTFACIKDWNDAVFIYNEERNKISGDIVGSIADYLGVKELPESLPYFQFDAPTALPEVKPLEVP
jgi:hypothetical protein